MTTTADFFADLERREREPLLRAATGTLRFDLADGESVEHWSVAIDKGAMSVSQTAAKADCVVSADRSTFDRIAGGEANAMVALVRGLVGVEGEIQLLLLFQRLFPGPPAAGEPERAPREDAT